ncbi:hypothetical protein NXS19_003115 [Fusarium pseudograminearum]|nr:hypothetical protein NXS19_003115 [Fusarium pseudograminearum]
MDAATQHQVKTPEEAVARIAYLSSDVIVSVQPAIGTDSEFSSHLNRYAGRKDSSLVAQSADTVPEIIPVRHNTDPLLSVYTPTRAGKLVSVTTTSTILLPSVSHLYKLANYPVVLHVSLQPRTFPDYSVITAIRNSGFTFVQSETLQEAQDLALTAHALAIRTGKGVIHFFAPSTSAKDKPIGVEDASVVRDVLDIESVRRYQAGSAPSSQTGIYADDGHIAVSSDHDAPATAGAASGNLTVPPSANASKAPSAGTSVKSSQDSESSTPVAPSSVATTVESAPPQVTSEDIYKSAGRIWAHLKTSVGREYSAFEYSGPLMPRTAFSSSALMPVLSLKQLTRPTHRRSSPTPPSLPLAYTDLGSVPDWLRPFLDQLSASLCWSRSTARPPSGVPSSLMS